MIYIKIVAFFIMLYLSDNNKHLMTGLEGNSEFCFPRISMSPRDEVEGNIEIRGKQNSLFLKGPVIKWFVI